MSTDLVLHQPPPSSIQLAAADMSAAAQLARALVETSFVPQHFRGKPGDAAAAIMYGDTINMDPVTALQNIHVISGKPGLYARAMVAVVLSHGHNMWTVESGPDKVIVAGQRKGSDKVETVEWTVARATKAGYTTNKKYATDPESMLYARASGDVARRVAPDALLGMAYNVEELMLAEQQDAAADAPQTPTERSAGARLAEMAKPVEAAEVGEPPAGDEPAPAEPDGPTQEVLDAMVAEQSPSSPSQTGDSSK